MAKKEKFNIRGSLFDTLNVHYRVGSGGENQLDDVLLVQAMFRFVALFPGNLPVAELGILPSELPELNGVCDAATQRCILAFQHKNNYRLLNVDGVIHPASYENRRLNYPAGARTRLMAITLLNQIANDFTPFDSPDSYIQGIIQLEPRLKQALA